MLYVDEIREYPRKGQWSHLWTDGDEDELHAFAARLGLKRSWLHVSNGIVGRFAHYDLRPSKRARAIALGAIEKPLKEWIAARKGA